jgi:transcriptional regulator with XRE-family HTH domain
MIASAELSRAGEVMREARKRQNLTLMDVERRTGIDVSSLSRFERGAEGRRFSRITLESLANAMRIEGRARLELFRPLGLPPAIEQELASPEFAGALEGARLPEATKAVLRHRHLARVAERYASAVPDTRGGPVDPEAVLGAHRIKVRVARGQRPQVQLKGDLWIDASGDRQRDRFLVAHGAAHAALVEIESDPAFASCSFPAPEEREDDANALTWHILVPGDRLRASVHALIGEPEVPWEREAGVQRILEIAERFDIPFLLAAKRLSEEGLLAEMCGLNEP